MSDSDIKLRACPFCASAARVYVSGLPPDLIVGIVPWVVRCHGCKANGPQSAIMREAAHAWNTRPAIARATP
jgi:hypothetical protein